jgi:hypothetical protein
VQGLFWVDEDLEDGFVRVEGDRVPRILMSLPTYRALAFSSSLQRLLDAAWDLRGTLVLPRAVIEPDAAQDLRQGLSLVDPEPSEVCVYPPCSLPATTVHKDGFPLCAEHTALMAGWDDLVA